MRAWILISSAVCVSALGCSWSDTGAGSADEAAGSVDAPEAPVAVDPNTEACVTKIEPGMKAHIEAMKSASWGARHADNAVPMFGCSAGAKAADCLATLDDTTASLGGDASVHTIRKLRDLPGATSFWVRSSADGRYAGIGGPGRIVDLEAGPTSTPIAVDAPYDPVFFPDNDGFGFAGTSGGITVCRASVLKSAQEQATPRVTFREPGCSSIVSSVYQTVGGALDGSLFWMSTGAHINDFGSEQGPSPGFAVNAKTTLTPMVSDGIKYVPKAATSVTLPYEGDQALSPSNGLVATRFGSKTGHRGFRIRKLVAGPATSGTGYTASTEVLGTVCLNGTKPIFSYDERFVVTHQYADPAEGSLAKTANIFLMDLATGESVQLTKVGARQLALFPHFRADGWIYFLLKDKGTGKETLFASDAAVRRLATR